MVLLDAGISRGVTLQRVSLVTNLLLCSRKEEDSPARDSSCLEVDG